MEDAVYSLFLSEGEGHALRGHLLEEALVRGRRVLLGLLLAAVSAAMVAAVASAVEQAGAVLAAVPTEAAEVLHAEGEQAGDSPVISYLCSAKENMTCFLQSRGMPRLLCRRCSQLFAGKLAVRIRTLLQKRNVSVRKL